ncbi:MAG: hypothetical protein HY557_01100 [Euryarchaeota archaeon]|nr:hypothetical protein [Euryarchaeota archaeon]
MFTDAQLRLGTRLLTLAAFLAFVGWIAIRHGFVFLLAVAFAVAAYAFFRAELRRNPIEVSAEVGPGTRDRMEDQTVVSPGVSAGGIHLSFETRSQRRTKR